MHTTVLPPFYHSPLTSENKGNLHTILLTHTSVCKVTQGYQVKAVHRKLHFYNYINMQIILAKRDPPQPTQTKQ